MRFTCSVCKAELEVPPCENGQHFSCGGCGTRFECRNGSLSALGTQPQNSVDLSCVIKPQIPKQVFICAIVLYVFTVINFANRAPKSLLFALLCACIEGSMAYGIQCGYNWVRILLTASLAIGWMFLCAENSLVGIFTAVVLAGPLILLWLPVTSLWMKEMALWRQTQHNIVVRNRVTFKILLFLLGGGLCCVSGILQDISSHWGNWCRGEGKIDWIYAFAPLIPIWPLLSVGYLFCEDSPFWIRLCQTISCLSGYWLLGHVCEQKKEANDDK